MSFQPIIPSVGLVGWRFLQRTLDTQLETFTQSSSLQRDVSAFQEKVADVTSAKDLVADRQLLSVALGAFGLKDDIANKYFIQKVLEEGVTAGDSLANKLSDDRYKQLSAAFGFGPGETRQTGNDNAMSQLVDSFFENEFEISVGVQDENLRVALYSQRELANLASGSESEDTKWYTLMSLPALRTMFETSLGLPVSFSQLDIDKQLEIFRNKTASVTGDDTVSQFSDLEKIEQLTDIFLARSQMLDIANSYSGASIALKLLQR